MLDRSGMVNPAERATRGGMEWIVDGLLIVVEVLLGLGSKG